MKSNQKEKDARKKSGYKKHKPPEKRCSNCKHSFCHNPGAYIPGIACRKVYPYHISIVFTNDVCRKWEKL